jgi:hypothetical protein
MYRLLEERTVDVKGNDLVLQSFFRELFVGVTIQAILVGQAFLRARYWGQNQEANN